MKSLGKTKRKYVWCIQEPLHMPNIAGLGIMNQPKPRVDRIICPHCKKKFNPRVHDCGDGNCWHAFLPPHKKWVKL